MSSPRLHQTRVKRYELWCVKMVALGAGIQAIPECEEDRLFGLVSASQAWIGFA